MNFCFTFQLKFIPIILFLTSFCFCLILIWFINKCGAHMPKCYDERNNEITFSPMPYSGSKNIRFSFGGRHKKPLGTLNEQINCYIIKEYGMVDSTRSTYGKGKAYENWSLLKLQHMWELIKIYLGWQLVIKNFGVDQRSALERLFLIVIQLPAPVLAYIHCLMDNHYTKQRFIIFECKVWLFFIKNKIPKIVLTEILPALEPRIRFP